MLEYNSIVWSPYYTRDIVAIENVQRRFTTQGLPRFADHSYSKRLLTAKHRLGRSLFLLKNRFFGPRTAKSQAICIRFCIHLSLYGIHLWVDLDRDWRVGGSRPNQNDCVFVILVTHPKSDYWP